jgi:hypothetical protein
MRKTRHKIACARGQSGGAQIFKPRQLPDAVGYCKFAVAQLIVTEVQLAQRWHASVHCLVCRQLADQVAP